MADLTAVEIEQQWHWMADCDDKRVWQRASEIMVNLQKEGMHEDDAALLAMRRVGWLPEPTLVSLSEQSAEEYDDIIRAQDLMGGGNG